MRMIGEPISQRWRIVLGVLSIAVLLSSYTILASWKAHQKRRQESARWQETTAKLTQVESELSRLRSENGAGASLTGLQNQRESLQRQVEELDLKRRTEIDRTMPTWGSLYRDGLLRALEPHGLSDDVYWLQEDIWATAKRLTIGVILAVILSVVLGIAMAAFAPVEALFHPSLSFLAKIPPTAMMAVFFVLAGTGYGMFITMIVFGTLPTLAQTVYQSAKKDIPPALIHKAYTLGATHAELIWNVMLRQILPRLIDAARLQIGPALVLLIAAEWLVAPAGFGHRLRLFYQRTDMTVVYVYLLILGTVGLLVDSALVRLRRWLCPWFGD